MPPKEKTPAEKAAERARILDAALEILAADGYQGLTMRRLGQQIGASATKIYLYFVNKDEVYLSVIIEGYRLLLDDLRQAVAAHTDPDARLDAFFQAYADFARTHPAFFQTMVQKKAPLQDHYAGTPLEQTARIKFDAGLEVLHLTRQLLDDCLEQKGQRLQIPSDMAAFCLLVFLNGLLNASHTGLAAEVFPQGDQLMTASLQLLKNAFCNSSQPREEAP